MLKSLVRPRHMSCISVSAFLLASRMVPNVVIPDPADLITISQCKCSVGDLERMQEIMVRKLDAYPHTMPITTLTMTRLVHAICGLELSDDVLLQLEILACDANCVNFRPSEIALVVLQPLPEELVKLSTLLGIGPDRTHSCAAAVQSVLARYNANAQVPHRQRLVWRLSHRTMKLLRPTDRLVRRLPTIDEQGVSVDEWDDDRPPTTFHCD